jgi:hypothetical protein
MLLRPLCFEISRRGRGHGTVLMTFVGSVHNPKIMLGMLVKVLCGDAIATRRRLPREGNVTFEDLMRGTSDFDVRTVTLEILTSMLYLLPIMVGIVAVIATMRSSSLSWSHDTCWIDGEVESLSNKSVSERLR